MKRFSLQSVLDLLMTQNYFLLSTYIYQILLPIYKFLLAQFVWWLDYRLDDRGVWIRFPVGARDLFLCLNVQTGSGAHAASFAMLPGGVYGYISSINHLGCALRISVSLTMKMWMEFSLYLDLEFWWQQITYTIVLYWSILLHCVFQF
jgi:hypothetical protein